MINVIPHHTVVDWDYSANITKTLDTTTFVSAPSSLKLTTALAENLLTAILCRIVNTQCIAQGEVRSWFKTNWSYSLYHLLFRNQAALGTSNMTNTYFWLIQWDRAHLYRYVAGVLSDIGIVWFTAITYSNWNHFRTIYWNGKNLAGVDALASELYREIAGVWTKLGDTLYDTDNKWKDSAVNRSGIGGRLYNTVFTWADDTEIWGAV